MTVDVFNGGAVSGTAWLMDVYLEKVLQKGRVGGKNYYECKIQSVCEMSRLFTGTFIQTAKRWEESIGGKMESKYECVFSLKAIHSSSTLSSPALGLAGVAIPAAIGQRLGRKETTVFNSHSLCNWPHMHVVEGWEEARVHTRNGRAIEPSCSEASPFGKRGKLREERDRQSFDMKYRSKETFNLKGLKFSEEAASCLHAPVVHCAPLQLSKTKAGALYSTAAADWITGWLGTLPQWLL